MEILAIIISAVSLLISLISFVLSMRSQRLQDKVNEMDLKLKEYELAQKEQEKQEVACVEARAIKLGNDKRRMKVWNSGNINAYNVVAMVEKESQIMILDNEKLPFEILEPGKSFDLVLVTHMGSASKFKIITKWEDNDKQEHSKVQYADL